MLCVEFSQVQYIDLGGIVHGLKDLTIVTLFPQVFRDSVTFWVIRCPWMEVKAEFQDPEKVLLSPE